MGSVLVDQISAAGSLVKDLDTTLSRVERDQLLLDALPGATVDTYAGQRVIRFRDQVILTKQVTYLGIPHPVFKKRIQIPRPWLDVATRATLDGLTTRFLGIYHYAGVTLFVDFDPTTYILRAMNNSAAHVATNDLYQAYIDGTFTRIDANGNRRTTIRPDLLKPYFLDEVVTESPAVDVFRRFSAELFARGWINVLDAVNEMHTAAWPDRFQPEWPGFYLEYRFDSFLRSHDLTDIVQFQKEKRVGQYDFDLVFPDGHTIAYYGDLKSSDIVKSESPGNDAADVERCVRAYGRFWYVIYEHSTDHARDHADRATIQWNRLRRSLGQVKADYDDLSYAKKLKENVLYNRMIILELNPANLEMVLGAFHQGRQRGGAERAVKVMIKKANIENFLIYSTSL